MVHVSVLAVKVAQLLFNDTLWVILCDFAWFTDMSTHMSGAEVLNESFFVANNCSTYL